MYSRETIVIFICTWWYILSINYNVIIFSARIIHSLRCTVTSTQIFLAFLSSAVPLIRTFLSLLVTDVITYIYLYELWPATPVFLNTSYSARWAVFSLWFLNRNSTKTIVLIRYSLRVPFAFIYVFTPLTQHYIIFSKWLNQSGVYSWFTINYYISEITLVCHVLINNETWLTKIF